MNTVTMKGYLNIYRNGFFHRAGKPGNMDRQSGDIYETYEEAIAHIDPPSHYIDTVPLTWQDVEVVRKNPADSVPISIRDSRKAYEKAIAEGRDPWAKEEPVYSESIAREYENGGSFA